MNGAIPPLPQYISMAWCSVKAQGQIYLLCINYPFQLTVLVLMQAYAVLKGEQLVIQIVWTGESFP
jgi:hypothetical protein